MAPRKARRPNPAAAAAPAPPLDAREVKLGKSVFTIGKLPAMEQFAVLETVRPCLSEAAKRLAHVNFMGGDPTEAIIANASMQIASVVPPDVLAHAQARLFSAIQFRDDNRSEPVPLAGREDEAFEEGAHIYELLVRSAYVNFSESFAGMISRIDGSRITSLLNTST